MIVNRIRGFSGPMAGVLALDALVAVGAFMLAVRLIDPAEWMRAIGSGLGFGALAGLVFVQQGVPRGMWRYAGATDLLRAARACAIAAAIYALGAGVFGRLDQNAVAALGLAAALSALGLAMGRLAVAAVRRGDAQAAWRAADPEAPAALAVGDARHLDVMLKDFVRQPGGPPFRIVGLIERSGGHVGRAIHGARILGGLDQLEPALMRLSRHARSRPRLVLADPYADRALMDRLVSAAADAGALLVRARGANGSARLSPVEAADLIGRPPRVLDLERTRRLVKGRRVLVTGAGGTIGGELTRQIARLEPAALVLIDAAEYNLYSIDLELRESGATCPWTAWLADVRDPRRIDQIFAAERPDVVLHAAALKHVPLMERNPLEAILTNVGGTLYAARAAAQHGASAFVLISTDKAVNPTNVMGASKRVAEMAVQAIDAQNPTMRAVAVRFGNVLGSTGSVVPLFERQIAAGGPVTVTHPEITRYFMTVEEAAALVLQAASLSRGADPKNRGVYVLDMGEPVAIDQLARQLIRLRGREPGRDIVITHTGLRPGEKLHEEIFYAAEVARPTDVDGVLMARTPTPDPATLEPALEALITAARARDGDAALDALKTLAPAFTGAEQR